jgi:nucleoside-diphosphate-sugar epimerase
MEIEKYDYEKLLVVGGSGFIGQHVVRKCLDFGFFVTVLSKNNYPDLHRLDKVTYFSVDISNKEDLQSVLRDKTFDYVVNLGGYIDHSNYSNGGSNVLDTHFNGVRNLVDCLDRTRIKKFVQIGSSDEYGGAIAPQSESQREAPISLYSCSKVLSTVFLQTLYKTENFPVVIFRLFLVYGSGQNTNRFIPKIIKGCLNNDKFPVSYGGQLRDFCYIDDVVNGIIKSFSCADLNGEVVNLASGNPVSIHSVIEMVRNNIGLGSPLYGGVPYRKGENMKLFADITKVNRLLDWKPLVSLKDGIQKTINYYND